MQQTQEIAALAAASLPSDNFVERVGAALSALLLAVAPHSETVWLVCGSGRKGTYGLEAARLLQCLGKSPVVTWASNDSFKSPDNLRAYERALAAGVRFQSSRPNQAQVHVDALSVMQGGHSDDWTSSCIRSINSGGARVIAIDTPTGLSPDTGQSDDHCVRADHTLSVLALTPGLYLARGRDAVGSVWITDLGIKAAWDSSFPSPTARLSTPGTRSPRVHDSHKGTYGTVIVVGGADGMVGAAILAGTAALHAGAGRVEISLLCDRTHLNDLCHPALMFRHFSALELGNSVVVCGCGGGNAITGILPALLQRGNAQVLDADALNAIARDDGLARLLLQRSDRGLSTILTPHPLEAARLLQTSVGEIQADRLLASIRIADRYRCVTVLKGAGTVIANPEGETYICPTGNAKLATAGTGDVLAGMIGATLAQGVSTLQAALAAVFRHGLAADEWNPSESLTAHQLAQSPGISYLAS